MRYGDSMVQAINLASEIGSRIRTIKTCCGWLTSESTDQFCDPSWRRKDIAVYSEFDGRSLSSLAWELQIRKMCEATTAVCAAVSPAR